MGYFEDLYSKKDQEREDQEKIQEQEDIKRMLQKYNDDVKYINKLIKAIIEKLSYEPPDKCDWICVNKNKSEENIVAWRIYNYPDYEDSYSIFLLPNGKLTYRYAEDAKYLEYVNYTEGLTFDEWRGDKTKVPFYCGIIGLSRWGPVDRKDYCGEYGEKLLRERFIVSAKSIFGVEIDKD